MYGRVCKVLFSVAGVFLTYQFQNEVTIERKREDVSRVDSSSFSCSQAAFFVALDDEPQDYDPVSWIISTWFIALVSCLGVHCHWREFCCFDQKDLY